MDITYEKMALAALKYCGLPTTTNNVHSMVIWACSENSYSDIKTKAKWNPWDTTELAPGDTNFNKVGVKNYPSIDVGLEAFKKTLFNGYYDHVVSALKASSVPALTCSLIADSPWGSNPSTELIATVLGNWSHYATLLVGGSTSDSGKIAVAAPVTIKVYKPPAEIDNEMVTMQQEIANLKKNSDLLNSAANLLLHSRQMVDLASDIVKEVKTWPK